MVSAFYLEDPDIIIEEKTLFEKILEDNKEIEENSKKRIERRRKELQKQKELKNEE